jgi:hypothetical protein
MAVEVVLVNGERRIIPLPRYTGSMANALARLDDWIKTEDGGWVQKRFIVEVRALEQERNVPGGSVEEFERLGDAAGRLADQATDEKR